MRNPIHPLLLAAAAFFLFACNLPFLAQPAETPVSPFAQVEATANAIKTQQAVEGTLLPAMPSASPTGGVSLFATGTPETPSAPGTPVTPAPGTATLSPVPLVSPTGTLLTAAPTLTPVPCNLATFVDDITIPDGTYVAPGEKFTKTWRLKNIGSCSWDKTYSLVFDNGNNMQGAKEVPFPDKVIKPGQTADLSVALTAPEEIGTHRGNWSLRSPEGVLFALRTGPFWVTITTEPQKKEYIAKLVYDESGTVKSNGEIGSDVVVGDTATNVVMQGFLSFDISGLPEGSKIDRVRIDFRGYLKKGDPFGALGCMYLFEKDFGELDKNDYFAGAPPANAAKLCEEQIQKFIRHDRMIPILESLAGQERARFRFQPTDLYSDVDNADDYILLPADIRLVIDYTAP